MTVEQVGGRVTKRLTGTSSRSPPEAREASLFDPQLQRYSNELPQGSRRDVLHDRDVQMEMSHLRFTVVEDSPRIGTMMRSIFEGVGEPAIESAATVRDAANQMPAFKPDVLLLGPRLSAGDIVGLTRTVRDRMHSFNPYLPIVLIAATVTPERAVAARDAGVTEVIEKPLTADDLLAPIYNAITEPRQFVNSASYFGPDRRRRTAARGDKERRRHRQVLKTEVARIELSGRHYSILEIQAP